MDEIRRLFVDTSAWLALVNANERRHTVAVEFQRSLPRGVTRITTWGVVAETYTWLRYRTNYRSAERWLNEEAALEERGVLHVVYPASDLEAGIRRILSRFAEHDLSYVDALSLHVMELRGDIDGVFAFDHHLSLVGVPVLPSAQ